MPVVSRVVVKDVEKGEAWPVEVPGQRENACSRKGNSRFLEKIAELGACLTRFDFACDFMEAFKLPQTIPQDLLLIQDLIAPTPSTEAPSASTTSQQLSVTNAVEVFPPPAKEEDDIGSSGEENDSEDEIAADLIKGASVDDDDLPKVSQIPL